MRSFRFARWDNEQARKQELIRTSMTTMFAVGSRRSVLVSK
jgi:hypothetical protein